jgi:hypothetical protein
VCLRDGDVDISSQRRSDGRTVGEHRRPCSRVSREEPLSERERRVDDNLAFRCTTTSGVRKTPYVIHVSEQQPVKEIRENPGTDSAMKSTSDKLINGQSTPATALELSLTKYFSRNWMPDW